MSDSIVVIQVLDSLLAQSSFFFLARGEVIEEDVVCK
jgi:hypothetical protein